MQPKRAIPGDEDAGVMLSLLEAVERDDAVTQRSLAQELDVALGLVNAYLKRCVKKGLIKVKEVPKRRFAYYLTPQGFAEKSRLTASYLSYSFDFFRRARRDCEEAMGLAAERGWTRLALIGVSDLAEIAVICAVEKGVTVTVMVDPASSRDRVLGIPVVADAAAVRSEFDAALFTDLAAPHRSYLSAVEAIGRERVLVPDLLASAVRRAVPEETS
jgi:DNA-binding MarR family transcriptional regulator